MKHLKRKAFVASNVGRAAVATGLSLSMLAGSLVTLPAVSFAADVPQSEFSKYAALVKKYAASKDLSPEQIEQLKREVNAAKDDYKESLKSPFKNYAEAVQEYANSGKLNKDQQQALKSHVQQTKKSWEVAKSGDNTPGNPGDNTPANPGDNTPVNPSASAANSGDTTPANPSAIQRYAQLLEKINSGKLTAEELKSAKAEANKLYKEIIQGSHNDKPENEDPKDTDKQSSDTDQNNGKQGGKQKGTPKTSDLFGISGLLGSVAGLVTLGAGFVARKRF